MPDTQGARPDIHTSNPENHITLPLPKGAVTSPCPSCNAARKGRGQYLCRDCWAQLPAPARRALSRRDAQAWARLRQLHTHLDSGRPLAHLEITP